MAKTIVGLFDNRSEAERVIQALIDEGFSRGDISLLASDAQGEYKDVASDPAAGVVKGAGAGAVIGGLAGLLMGIGALAIPGVGPVLAAGPLAAALAGAGMGAVAGGIIGALANMGIPEEEAKYYAESVRRGGTLVAVKTRDDRAERAAGIMNRHGAGDIEQRVAEWRQTGWTGFDPNAEPYKVDVERERAVRVPIVNEELEAGKRQIGRGGVRVYHHGTEPLVEHDPPRKAS